MGLDQQALLALAFQGWALALALALASVSVLVSVSVSVSVLVLVGVEVEVEVAEVAVWLAWVLLNRHQHMLDLHYCRPHPHIPDFHRCQKRQIQRQRCRSLFPYGLAGVG
jgi:hypothetical protein